MESRSEMDLSPQSLLAASLPVVLIECCSSFEIHTVCDVKCYRLGRGVIRPGSLARAQAERHATTRYVEKKAPSKQGGVLVVVVTQVEKPTIGNCGKVVFYARVQYHAIPCDGWFLFYAEAVRCWSKKNINLWEVRRFIEAWWVREQKFWNLRCFKWGFA